MGGAGESVNGPGVSLDHGRCRALLTVSLLYLYYYPGSKYRHADQQTSTPRYLFLHRAVSVLQAVFIYLLILT